MGSEGRCLSGVHDGGLLVSVAFFVGVINGGHENSLYQSFKVTHHSGDQYKYLYKYLIRLVYLDSTW